MIKTKIRKLLRQSASMVGVTAVATRNIPFGFDWLLDIQRLGSLWGLSTDTFFDVGANDGTVSIRILERFPNAWVHAFEPHPKVFRTLQILADKHRISCHNLALSASEGTATLYAPDYDKMSTLIPNIHGIENGSISYDKFDVKTTTLDAFCSNNMIAKVDVLKVDAEGHDFVVVKSAINLLSGRAINFIYVEFSDLVRDGDDQSGALYPIAAFLYPLGLRFIASYTEQVGAPDKFSLVSNALFAMLPI